MKILNEQEIENVFVGALEGGSNYWYTLSNEATAIIRKFVSKKDDAYLSTAFPKAVMLGAEVPVNDIENKDEVLGIVSKKSIAEGLIKAWDDERPEIANFRLEQDDANDADVLFQYFVMGEIVFG